LEFYVTTSMNDPVESELDASRSTIDEATEAEQAVPDRPDVPDLVDAPGTGSPRDHREEVEGEESDGTPDSAAGAETEDSEASLESSGDDENAGVDRAKLLEHEGDIAADYLEALLDIADLDGDIDMDVEGDRAVVSIVGGDLRDLVGPEGQVLDALQELTRLAVLRETGERSRLMLDIDGHRARRREQLAEVASKAVAEVQSSGTPVSLDPMNPFERKVVHDVVAAAGLTSESEGVEPDRFVVVHPA
jgi:spoIIIJ-associated protein